MIIEKTQVSCHPDVTNVDDSGPHIDHHEKQGGLFKLSQGASALEWTQCDWLELSQGDYAVEPEEFRPPRAPPGVHMVRTPVSDTRKSGSGASHLSSSSSDSFNAEQLI